MIVPESRRRQSSSSNGWNLEKLVFIRACGVEIGFWFYSGSVLLGCVEGIRKVVPYAFLQIYSWIKLKSLLDISHTI